MSHFWVCFLGIPLFQNVVIYNLFQWTYPDSHNADFLVWVHQGNQAWITELWENPLYMCAYLGNAVSKHLCFVVCVFMNVGFSLTFQCDCWINLKNEHGCFITFLIELIRVFSTMTIYYDMYENWCEYCHKLIGGQNLDMSNNTRRNKGLINSGNS